MEKDLKQGIVFEVVGYLISIFTQGWLLWIGGPLYLIGSVIILISKNNWKTKILVTVLPALVFYPLMFFLFKYVYK